MKAIETMYRGYRFRSRLEARWAVFFTSLSILFEYEKEGFDLGDAGLYLPDFWLPDQECWVEIKATAPTNRESVLAGNLSLETGSKVYILSGECWIPSEAWWDHTDDEGNVGGYLFEGTFSNDEYCVDYAQAWCECTQCGRLDIRYEGWSNRNKCTCNNDKARIPNSESPRLVAAYAAARRARFEHGENGS